MTKFCTFLALLIVSFIGSSIESPVSIIAPRDDDPYRLPENLLKVLHYEIELTLYNDVFDTNTFEGHSAVNFTILENTNTIKIHADGMNFSSVSLVDNNENPITLQNEEFAIDPVTTFVTINTVNTLQAAATYILHFDYTSLLRTDAFRGFYKSSYQTLTGETKHLATTQFQTTFARRAFPCFDEPSYKATFDIKITHPSEYNAKSNTQGNEIELPSNPGYKQTTFDRTPIMPTYLIAFVVSDFTCTDGVDVDDDVSSAVCSKSETEGIRDFGVDIGPKILWAIEHLTGVKYSASGLTKLHQFGIPDFAAGAMENWGLVTYREYYILWDPNHSTNRYKQYVATIISHEFGHFWFGDLVTTHWWSDTFLNEGFATYYEYFGAAEVLPDWELDKQFVIDEVHYGLSVDQSLTSTPLSYKASSPAEVSARFGTVSYSKGGAVFRMVEHFIGSARYKLGIKDYLEANAFKNTKPEDLWSALEPYATNLPATLPTVMSNWVNIAGFPLLKVTRNGNNVVVSQQRFLLSGTDTTSKWYVPITYTKSTDANKFQNTETRAWLLPTENLVIEDAASTADAWIILNNFQAGFYRVDYDANLWQNILKALKEPQFSGIPDLNRGHFVDDLYYMARAGVHSFVEFLEFISFLEKDDSYFAWYETFTAINYLLPKVGEEKVRTFIIEYMGTLLKVFFDSVPLNQPKDDEHIYSLKRALAGSWGCRLGYESCKEYAVAAFTNYVNTNNKPDKNLRSTIYCNGLRYSNKITEDWDFLFKKFLEETSLIKTNMLSSIEQSSMLSALGCPNDQAQIKIFLEKSIDPTSGMTPALLSSAFSAIYTNSYGGIDTSIDFVIENHKKIADFYTSYDIINTLISSLGSRFTKKAQLDKLNNFIETSDLPEANKQSARNVLASARVNVAWTETFEKEVISFYDLGNDGNSGSFIFPQLSVILLAGLLVLLHRLYQCN